ncbi:HBL/NHE enterotoxin family protein [Mesorhizobium sp.]|uniref:HBL/NHE enterotoxin family protein n=1 Tax=Mesorhizobium sp. TaxID=1871066 RepID=UPI000FE2E148|nr:HBL/NHE enterotoxin family protein [Mesorhizobium sp.]RWN59382.1 MAG: hypothetical protein EOR98_03125 [Mesorhizobium sp.]RWN80888.1 MAG: hypothetical protein EOS02_03120 [Mesorhizobium sp.]RWN83325.1 MAG: hypothetical protein EOS01_03220 [Mesorhizobium sp.]RWN86763.1 MAG: hypothetical protein EOS04_17860 [Mesorhizobium sp.]RWO16398.1 MAG: hypothetical protein EOS15_05255 [Mesorhizobium sp.]
MRKLDCAGRGAFLTTSLNTAPSWVSSATEAGTTTAGQITMVNLAAAAILDQKPFPELVVPVLSDLNSHLVLAQNHARFWKNNTSVDLLREVQSLIYVGGLFRQSYDQIQPLLLQMGNDTAFDPATTSQIANVLVPIHNRTAKEGAAASLRYGDIRTFSEQVRADHQTFKTDYDEANQSIGSQSEAINQLRSRLDQLDARITNDQMMWGFGASAMVVGGLIVACGALLEIPSGGTSTIIIAAGAAVIGAGGAATAWGAADHIISLQKKAKITKEIAADQAQLALIDSAKGLLGDLSTKIDTLDNSVQKVLTAWQDLDSGLQLVLSDVQQPEERLARLRQTQQTARPGDVAAAVAGELKAADEEWEKALPILEGLLDKGSNMQYVSVVETNKLPAPDVIAHAYARAA